MNSLQACWKALRVLGYILIKLPTVAFSFPKLTQTQKGEKIQTWCLGVLAVLTIKLVIKGAPPKTGPMLLAANHISWLDIVVMLAAQPCHFVAKAELQHWPLIGMLARAAGTLFIARESPRDALRVVHHMAEQLRSDAVLAVFPEGTTSSGLQLLPFHANLFQAAISAHAPVQPVALRFVEAHSGQPSLAPCYIGDDSLLESMWRTFKAPPLCAVVSFGDPQLALDRDRRAWAADVRAAVDHLRTAI